MHSCAPTKYLEENQHIVNKIKFVCKNSEFDEDDFIQFLKQKKLRKTFWIAFHARIYNSVNHNKTNKRNTRDSIKLVNKNTKIEQRFDDRTGKFIDKMKEHKTKMYKANINNNQKTYNKEYTQYLKDSIKYSNRIKNRDEILLKKKKNELKTFAKYLMKIGEKPDIYDSKKIIQASEQFKLFLKSKGYFYAQVTIDTIFKRKKANITYYINTNQPIKIGDIIYDIQNSEVNQIIENNKNNFALKKNENLDIELIQTYRTEIANLLNNNGYYDFSKQFVKFVIDTVNKNNKAILTTTIKEPDDFKIFNKYKIKNVFIFSEYNPQLALAMPTQYFADIDTFVTLNDKKAKYQFLLKNKFTIIPQAIVNDISIYPDSNYSYENVKNTYKYLSSFKIYKLSNIQFYKIDTINNLINCNIQLTPTQPQSRLIEFQGTNTSGNIGATSNIKYQHKNLRRRGQVLDIKLSLTLESHKIYNDTITALKFRGFNTQEYMLESSLEIPKLYIKSKNLKKTVAKYNPKTLINLGFNYQNRPEYTRTIANISFAYYWKSADKRNYMFAPVRLNLIRVPPEKMDSIFVLWLNKTFTKESYEDQFIFGTNFSYSFSNQKNAKPDFIYYKLNIATSGNTVDAIVNFLNVTKITDITKDQTGAYTVPIVNSVYSQFFKMDIDFRYYNVIDKNNTIVYRIFLGAGLPYKNSNLLPFNEQYFCGGSNGIRAWQIRSLGPGSFKLNDDNLQQANSKILPFQSSDIKIEGNIEYRIKFVGITQGAFFIDYGNIWAINQYDNRPNSLFVLKNFYKEIAIGTGAGIRLDISFLILRFDLGIKLKDPILPEGQRWIPKSRNYRWSDLGFNFGIGYPF